MIWWLSLDPFPSFRCGDPDEDPPGNPPCNIYLWLFCVYNRESEYTIFRFCSGLMSVGLLLLTTGSFFFYWRLYPGSIIRAALGSSKDLPVRGEKKPRYLFDLQFIYPAADIMVLMDVVSKSLVFTSHLQALTIHIYHAGTAPGFSPCYTLVRLRIFPQF